MKTYEAVYITEKPDWANIPAAAIDSHLWSDVRTIVPSAQLAWDENHLYIRLKAQEPHILRRYTGNTDPVYEDSCLEFFFSPGQVGDRYFNFEANPNGALFVGYGRPGGNRCRLLREDFRTLLSVAPFEIPGGWGLELTIPLSFIQIYAPDFSLEKGIKFRANFYKCGDETLEPHYIAWNPVEASKPCFHLPEFFGEIVLV